MAFEYITSVRDPLYPIGDNRDERILVEFNGIIHSEAEDIFYGMKNCPILEAHPFKTYNRLLLYDPYKVYEEIGFFRPVDLVKYLNDGEKIDNDEINAIIEYSKLNYDFSTATLISMAGALRNLINADYVKQITFVLSNNRKTDILYLMDIFDNALLKSKGAILETNPNNVIESIEKELLEAAENNSPYTTIITNEYQLILDICKDYKKYKADTNFFLLRNHSQNMKQSIKGDSVIFNELYTDEIIGAINGDVSKSKLENLDFPIKAKFGRFSPTPYITSSPSFMTFGENIESDG